MALEIVAFDPAYIPQVAKLFQLGLEEGEGDYPKFSDWFPDFPMVSFTRYLVYHGHDTHRVITCLGSPRGGHPVDAAIFALSHAPDLAPALFRRALREDNCDIRLTAAAALALTDTPWSRQVLIAPLEESDDVDQTAEVRMALRESRDPAAHNAVDAWEATYPRHGENDDELAYYDRLESVGIQLDNRMNLLKPHLPPYHVPPLFLEEY